MEGIVLHSYFSVVHPSSMEFRYAQNNRIKKGTFRHGDTLHITNHGFQLKGSGWFIRTYINETVPLFIAFEDIDRATEKKMLMNAADMEMKATMWRKQLDQALSEQNKEWFTFISRKLSSLQSVSFH